MRRPARRRSGRRVRSGSDGVRARVGTASVRRPRNRAAPARAAQERPRPPREIRPQLNPRFEAAILRALEKDPEARFQDIGQLTGALVEARSEVVAATGAATPTPTTPAVHAVVTWPGAEPRRLPVTEISRGGLFVTCEAFPPLFSRVRAEVSGPGLATSIELAGEVVRHVAPPEAAAWGMSPGFAVQIDSTTPSTRAALERLASALRPRDVKPVPEPPDPSRLATRLDDLRARASGTHYDLLGLPFDADFAEVRRTARALTSELDALRDSPLTPEQTALVATLLAHAEAAASVLGTPGERLGYDAARGNYLGVTRCIAAGIPAAVLEARRRAFLAERPGAEERAQHHLGCAQVARALHNASVAVGEYESALGADPLNPALHDAYWALRRQLAEKVATT